MRPLVHAKRPKAWAQGYPAAVRARVCAYVALAPSLPVLISPKGYRVEGLDVVALAALLAVVG